MYEMHIQDHVLKEADTARQMARITGGAEMAPMPMEMEEGAPQ